MEHTEERRGLGTYGFRFGESAELPLCGLFAVGHEREESSSYSWDGMERTDGPLLLFQYTVSGGGAAVIEDRSRRIEEGQALLVEIPGRHRYYLPEDREHWEFYFILMNPRLILPVWEEAKAKLGEVASLPPDSEPIRLLRQLVVDAQAGRIDGPYSASSSVYQFAMALGRYAASPLSERSEWPESVAQAVSFINGHYADMTDQEQLAKRLGVSKYHFLRTFARYAGMTPNDYLMRVRIEKSMELLQATDWPLERIARSVGYSTGSYYIKIFRRLTGQTPGSFRASGSNGLHYRRLFFD
ncbi:helix-turn-helix transcriptional regulator [Cohnella thailandensis]|uniref:AraC family transcriptional regulator n=1 Tax=Cohnella thailandensis TaxID=557557 RepID=A0A841SV72_9BACL|nr:AraC family transcriptional regulator [Cohnella thailandensis]MBB6634889.1 AraC family transcriptional regulator [Cohnella thailandensis]MBP1975889.1 AraC-like DNA-binding protein [Cohnella thailandensis]